MQKSWWNWHQKSISPTHWGKPQVHSVWPKKYYSIAPKKLHTTLPVNISRSCAQLLHSLHYTICASNILVQCFSTFFGSRHPLRFIKFWRHPYVVQTITWGTLICKSAQVWLRAIPNPKVGGTPGTFSRHPSVPRHPGWESLY